MVEYNTGSTEELMKVMALKKEIKFCEKGYRHPIKKTLFDFDLSNPKDRDYKKNLLKCWYSLNHEIDPQTRHVSAQNSCLGVFKTFTIESVSSDHGHAMYGMAAFLFQNIINHSCYSNVLEVHFNGQQILYVTRPIKAGEQIFYNYASNDTVYGNAFVNIIQPLQERKDHIRKIRGIDCNCYFCVNDITDEKLQKFDPRYPDQDEFFLEYCHIVYQLETSSQIVAFMKRIFERFNEQEENPISYEIAHFKKYWHKMVRGFAHLMTFPCMKLIRGSLPEDLYRKLFEIGRDVHTTEVFFTSLCSCHKNCNH